jgi:transposase
MTNVELNCFFEIIERGTKNPLDAYFETMADKHKVEVIVTDLWNHYRLTVDRNLPGVVHVADRFHVTRLASDAIDNRRLRVRMRLKGDEHEAERIELKDAAFALLDRHRDLTEEGLEVV